jgi:hypothetical protein
MLTPENDNPFDVMVENLRLLFDSKANITAKVIREDVLTSLTDEELNLEYPDATIGMQVICPFITGGGELYEKFNDVSNAWFRLYMTKGGSSISPGVMQDIEIENFV